MASAFALAIFSGIFIIFFVKLKNLRIFQFYFFTGGGRNGQQHLIGTDAKGELPVLLQGTD